MSVSGMSELDTELHEGEQVTVRVRVGDYELDLLGELVAVDRRRNGAVVISLDLFDEPG